MATFDRPTAVRLERMSKIALLAKDLLLQKRLKARVAVAAGALLKQGL